MCLIVIVSSVYAVLVSVIFVRYMTILDWWCYIFQRFFIFNIRMTYREHQVINFFEQHYIIQNFNLQMGTKSLAM